MAAERAGPRPPWPAQPCPFLSQVELATGQFPYKNCKTDFEVLTKVLQEEPPLLPGHMGFSGTSSPSSKTGEHSPALPSSLKAGQGQT